MPKLSNIIHLLPPREAARLGATSRTMRNLSRHRLAPIRARHNVAATQAARLARTRYKANKRSHNLNKIYNSLEAVGILYNLKNFANKNEMKEFINLYGKLQNSSINLQEQARLQRKMIKWRRTLVQNMQTRIKQYHNLYNRNILNMSPGSTPNYN